MKPERVITDEERELLRELDALTPVMLDACALFVTTRSAESFKTWTSLNAQYVDKHRRWWALAMPEVPYESVFGVPA